MDKQPLQFMAPAMWYDLFLGPRPSWAGQFSLHLEHGGLLVQGEGKPQFIANAHPPLVQMCALWGMAPTLGIARVYASDMGKTILMNRSYQGFLRLGSHAIFERLDFPGTHATFMMAAPSEPTPKRWRRERLVCLFSSDITAHAKMQIQQNFSGLRGLSEFPASVTQAVLARAHRFGADPNPINPCSEISLG